MDDEIDLRDVFRVMWKRRLLIIGVFVVVVMVAGVISFAMPSVYRVSSIIAVGNFGDPIYTSQASVKNVMLSDEFLQDVFEQISPNATSSEFATFKNSVKVEPVKDSDKLIEISIETPKGQEGKVAVEKIIWLYANRSEDSYNAYKKILSDQLAVAEERLNAMDKEINLTLEAVTNIQDSPGSSDAETELRFSRTLDRLNSMETQRSALIAQIQDLQKQLELLKHQEIVQPARMPVSPVGPRRALMVAIAGMLGLMVGIFAAFLREALWRPAE